MLDAQFIICTLKLLRNMSATERMEEIGMFKLVIK